MATLIIIVSHHFNELGVPQAAVTFSIPGRAMLPEAAGSRDEGRVPHCPARLPPISSYEGAADMRAMYPWPGEFHVGDPEKCVAVATLSRRAALPSHRVAIWGEVRTENIGVEKVAANCISNPNIRFLILWGEDVRGHRSGDSLLALGRDGVDDGNRIIGARGALPFIENLPREAIERFRAQVEVVDMMGNTSVDDLLVKVTELEARDPGPMEGPFIAVRVERAHRARGVAPGDSVAIHASLNMDPYGQVTAMEAR